MKLTSKEEDYLETIYRLSCNNDTVGVSDIARVRGVTSPTVISAVSRLKESGLVSQRHYGKIFLSESGLARAKEIYRIHQAIKSFLIDVLQLPVNLSESEACKLEHAVSKKTIERLVTFMETFHNCPARQDTCRDIYNSISDNDFKSGSSSSPGD